jgi:hypothetical protein
MIVERPTVKVTVSVAESGAAAPAAAAATALTGLAATCARAIGGSTMTTIRTRAIV